MPALPQPPDELEQSNRLVVGQCGRRLVEDQHPCLVAERPGDLDHLTLAEAQAGHPRLGLDVDTELVEDRLGTGADLLPADETSRAGQPAEEDVLGNRQRCGVVELLVDHPDPEKIAPRWG